MTRRTLILLAALGAVLVLTSGWSYQYMVDQRASAIAARNDMADGLRMMSQIEEMGRQPTLVADRERLSTETTSLIESAANLAQISPASLRRISPEAPRRLGDTAYKEKPTQVLLQGITLTQLVGLTSNAPLQQAGLNVEAIRLSAPREADSPDRWDAEIVLTYLVYDPPQAGKQEKRDNQD